MSEENKEIIDKSGEDGKVTTKARYFKAQDMTKKDWATPQFMVCYEVPGEQHIMCGGMYEWAADWLVDLLNSTGEFPTPV